MNTDESSYPRKLADSDLDWLLTTANKDLLAHIEAAADPTSTLAGIMARTSLAGPGDNPATITANSFWGSLNRIRTSLHGNGPQARIRAGARLMQEGEQADHVAVFSAA